MTSEPTRSAASEPTWRVPFPYGQAGAIESMGSIAAPLLAGLSATLAVLVIGSEDEFRWPAAALLLLVAATVFLVAAVQLTFWARRFTVTPAELRMWWPDLPEDDPELRWEQAFHRRRQEAWTRWARRAYNSGLVSFLAALTVALVPPGCLVGYRLPAFVLATAGLLGELAWITLTARNFFDRPDTS